jgi:hypothetical protein
LSAVHIVLFTAFSSKAPDPQEAEYCSYYSPSRDRTKVAAVTAGIAIDSDDIDTPLRYFKRKVSAIGRQWL